MTAKKTNAKHDDDKPEVQNTNPVEGSHLTTSTDPPAEDAKLGKGPKREPKVEYWNVRHPDGYVYRDKRIGAGLSLNSFDATDEEYDQLKRDSEGIEATLNGPTEQPWGHVVDSDEIKKLPDIE